MVFQTSPGDGQQLRPDQCAVYRTGKLHVVVSNAWGEDTSPVAVLEVGVTPVWQTAFPTTSTSTRRRTMTNRSSTDTRVTFNYNYAADGIPHQPPPAGKTRGVKFEANLTLANVAAINISAARPRSAVIIGCASTCGGGPFLAGVRVN